MTVAARHDLGDFAVGVDADEVAAFRKATGVAEGIGVPLTFPMRWMADPDVRGALAGLTPTPDVVLVHEAQSFTYEQPLSVGESYTLRIVARREVEPDRLVLDASVMASGAVVRARLETTLRLISAQGMTE